MSETNKKTIRPKNVLAAFAVAPLGGASVVTLIVLIFGVSVAGWTTAGGGIAVTAMVFVLISTVGYAVEIVAGIPGYFLMRRLGRVTGAQCITLGAVLGTVVAAIWPVWVLFLNPDVIHGIAAVAVFSTVGLLWGAASGLVFAWMVRVDPPA